MTPPLHRRQLFEVSGIVQGVGFRPFIYSLATSLGLIGFVLNHSRGVTIEVEGTPAALDAFRERLTAEAPMLARIDSLTAGELTPLAAEARFEIRESVEQPDAFSLVPADIATCEACLADLTNRANRRFGYPFTNCTNCGPRYTIIEDVPYDRPTTTMREFPMCADCAREYADPSDRRFHAQPNACPICGPWVELGSFRKTEAIEEARRLLRDGAILAVKGLGGFHLACDALNDEAVRRLRARKRRSDKPFAVMAPDLAAVERLCHVTDAERAILTDARRPIVLLGKRPDSPVAPACAPGNATLGVMLPYTPLHHLLLEGFEALVMTSGNISEEPIVSRNEEVAPRLASIYDAALVHNRRIQTRVDDSVVRVFEGRPRLLRRSRGFAPQAIASLPLRHILAVGGELKNTFCLTRDRYAILSQHIGDMENMETLDFFRETFEHMRRFFRVEPVAVAHDLHPGYLSTKFALSLTGLRPIGVQHHHAHVAACLADNGVSGPATGVAFDGTGYGLDGAIWGGEFLAVDGPRFERPYHLRYVVLPGGDTAVREPWRMALSYSMDAGVDLPMAHPHAALVRRMIERNVNCVRTSSCGRLFDAVASLAGVRHEVNFEGQAAIELESIAAQGRLAPYAYAIADGEVDLRPMIREIVAHGEDAAIIAARFHETLAAVIVDVCRRIGRERVCLTGGTFQNWRLLTLAVTQLRDAGFDVLIHERVPANDGGIALGQALIANAILSE